MYTKQHANQNEEMLAVALEITAEHYDKSRDGTKEYHDELQGKVLEALKGFDATKDRKRSFQAKALRVHRGVVTREREQKKKKEMIERMEEQAEKGC